MLIMVIWNIRFSRAGIGAYNLCTASVVDLAPTVLEALGMQGTFDRATERG